MSLRLSSLCALAVIASALPSPVGAEPTPAPLGGGPRAARALPSGTQDTAAPPGASIARAAPRHDPDAAMALSLLGTIGGPIAFIASLDHGKPGLALGSAAAIAGPGLGYLYQGKLPLGGTGLRIAAMLGLLGAGATLASCEGSCRAAEGVAIGSAMLYLGSSLYDVIGAGRLARRAREERRVGIAPLVLERGAGVVLAGSL